MTINDAINLSGLVMMIATAILTYRNWRSQQKHHRLIEIRILFLDLWGGETYEFIKTSKGWHGISYRSDGDVIKVGWK